MCGGTSQVAAVVGVSEGLSPRVRGNHFSPASFAAEGRSIPACAGEPRGVSSGLSQRKVYPRVCGGTRGARTREPTTRGLSPRVRGNRAVHGEQAGPVGSIPACAGEPRPRKWEQRWLAVYPRVCGGTADTSPLGHTGKGLSPRVRGNPSAAPHRFASPGSIPACAGEPNSRVMRGAGARVYPRVCGGTW